MAAVSTTRPPPAAATPLTRQEFPLSPSGAATRNGDGDRDDDHGDDHAFAAIEEEAAWPTSEFPAETEEELVGSVHAFPRFPKARAIEGRRVRAQNNERN